MLFDTKENNFYLKNGKQLDLNNMEWKSIPTLPDQLIELHYTEAVKKLQNSKNKIKVPVGIIGSNNPSPQQYQTAEKLGQEIAQLGLSVVCGGRAGIMEAVCKGAHENGGTSIGILPEIDLKNVNRFVTIPLATGIGLARNAIIAASSLCLVAIGGSYGTLSEIAYGLQFGKKVFTIDSALRVDGAYNCHTVEEVIHHLCKIIFNVQALEEQPEKLTV